MDYPAAMPESYEISTCPAHQCADALRVLHAGLAEDEQDGLLHALNTINKNDAEPFSGLLIAQSCGEISAVIWVQIQPGRTAVVWLPQTDHPAALDLVRAATEFLDKRAVALAQILTRPETHIDPRMLVAGDFKPLALLNYLTVGESHFPPVQPNGKLEFEPLADDQPARLAELLLATYEGSLDCPALNGIREPQDTILGYRAQSNLTTRPWYFVRHQHQDVGVLILDTHKEGENWELVYMGIVPDARGKGFGWQILQHALWLASQGGTQRMVLAVDEDNEHALRTYRRAGFVMWDRRQVFARLRRSK